eukprot:gene10572-biopygen8044
MARTWLQPWRPARYTVRTCMAASEVSCQVHGVHQERPTRCMARAWPLRGRPAMYMARAWTRQGRPTRYKTCVLP